MLGYINCLFRLVNPPRLKQIPRGANILLRIVYVWPNQWAIFSIQINKPPQINPTVPRPPPQRKFKALAARIVSKPAAFQHPYCAVLYWVLYRQARRRRRFFLNQNRTCPPEGQFSKEIYNKNIFFRLLQGYPFCWARLQNNRASKPPQNNPHFPTARQRKSKTLAARIISKPAALQHSYCIVYCTVYCTGYCSVY